MPSSLRLARSADGTPLLGDANGFVPLRSAAPNFDERTALSRAAANQLPSVDDATSVRRPPDELSFGSPLERFGKLWGIGLNYYEHAEDLNETRPDAPASFMKPKSTLTGPGGPIRLPARELTERVTGEAELGVVIGRTCTHVSPEEADRVVAGLVPVIDMTAEDILAKNPRFLTRSKSFDTFLVVGPWLETARALDTLGDFEVRTVVDGETVAANTVDNMAFSPAELVAFHSRVMTLEPGDLISTGTPGAHVLEPGITIRAEVEGVGSVGAVVV